MVILYRIALAIMGLSALYAGGLNMLLASGVVEKFYFVELAEGDVTEAIDIQVRILAGMWTAMGLFVLFSIRNFSKYIVALHFVFLGFALSAIGEFASAALLGSALEALPKALVQVGVSAGMSLWSHVVAGRFPDPKVVAS